MRGSNQVALSASRQERMQLGGGPAHGLFEVCQLVERRLQLLRPLSLEIVERLLLCSSCILPRAFSSSNWRTCRAELTRVCSVALLVKIERQACSDLFGRCRLHGGRRARCPASLGPRSRARRARCGVHAAGREVCSSQAGQKPVYCRGEPRVNTVARECRVAHHGASVRQIWSWLSSLSSRRLQPSAPHGVRCGLSA